jgi:hypothetical protein
MAANSGGKHPPQPCSQATAEPLGYGRALQLTTVAVVRWLHSLGYLVRRAAITVLTSPWRAAARLNGIQP